MSTEVNLFPNASKRAEINEVLTRNQQILDSAKAANRASKRQQELWEQQRKFDEDKARRKAELEGFKLEPYGTQIRMKDAEDLANRRGYYASFPELANEYVRQNSNDKKTLDKFKRMNPIEQRDFLAKEVESIFKKGGDSFLKVYNDAMNKAGTSVRAFFGETFKNLQRESQYLSSNATKQDLSYQRYKDAFNVPYWSNKAINDFIQKDIIPIGGKKEKVDFDRRGNKYAKLMFEFKQDPNSETPEYDFYNKVKKDYNTKPFEDRFGSVPLSERFKNKQEYAQRGAGRKLIGFGERFIPVANTIEQAAEAGVNAMDIPVNLPNIAETAFDAATIYTPLKLAKLGNLGSKIPLIRKIPYAEQVGPLVKSSLVTGAVGAKGAFEGEDPASIETRLGNSLLGLGVGVGAGSLPYTITRMLPKYATGGILDKQAEKLNEAYKAKSALEDVQSKIDAYAREREALNLRGELFNQENLGQMKSYVDKYGGAVPMDLESATPMERYNWASRRLMNEKAGNTLVNSNIEPSSYEVVGADPIKSPLQNLRRPNVDFSSPRAVFENVTTYSPVGVADTPAMNDRLTAAVNYFMQNPKYRGILENLGISNTKDFSKTDIGKAIYSEMVNYLDEPIAKFVLKGNKDPKVFEAAKMEWMKRNFPRGADDNAERIFNEKVAIAKSGYRPSELPTGRIEDTQFYKDTKKLVKENKALSKRLEGLQGTESDIDAVSQELADIRNKATGDVNTKANVAGILKTQMSPNVVPQKVFERVEATKGNTKSVLDLYAQKKDLQAKSVGSPSSKEELDKELEKIRYAKKGFSPATMYATSALAKPTGYMIENAPLVELNEDELYMPYSGENIFLKTIRGATKPIYYWDSPLMQMRSAGSFKIPMQEKK